MNLIVVDDERLALENIITKLKNVEPQADIRGYRNPEYAPDAFSIHASGYITKPDKRAVDVKQFECDYYLFMEGDVSVINTFRGEYMTNYSWAEFTTAQLFHQYQN